MIGSLITKIREEKNMTKTELARIVDIDLGHLTHIEKGERIPSRKTLKKICFALNIPYHNFLLAYDTPLEENCAKYSQINCQPYNKIIAFDSINNFIDCPHGFEMASFALKVTDSSMCPILNEGDFAYIDTTAILKENDIGLFKYKDHFLLRYFITSDEKIILKPANSKYKIIEVSDKESFNVIGKIL